MEHSVQRCIEAQCSATYTTNQPIYTCPKCGGLLDIESQLEFDEGQKLRAVWLERKSSFTQRDRSGVWRFREFLPFDSDVEPISLDEGNTPLYDAPRSASYCGLDALKLKHQGCNPTGSFKDTGMTVAITQAQLLGMRLVACASTGNTAASLAAYAARANLACAILVPQGQVSLAKLAQSLDYGARVLEIEGNFDDCMNVIRQVSEMSSVYLVNSINPFRIEGQKTVAFELAEQLSWKIPDHLIVPGGNLGNSSALGKGFRELFRSKLIDRQPRITVVQASGAAPFARLYETRKTRDANATLQNDDHPHTLASAIKIGAPVSWKKAWRTISETHGEVLTVSEHEIADAKAVIGRDGVGCEPASATTVAGIKKLVQEGVIRSSENVVAVLTGHALKDTDYIIKYHSDVLVEPDEKTRIKSHFANHPIKISSSPDAVSTALNELMSE